MFLLLQVFWSDSNQGTIESYDIQTNEMIILAKSLEKPGSLAIDSSLKLLFWCNFVSGGSIERIDFYGGNRCVKYLRYNKNIKK